MRGFVLPLVCVAGLPIGSAALADPAQPASASAQAAPAATTTPAAAPDDSDAIDPLDKIVCRRMPAKTGSRLGHRRVCFTQREWDAVREHEEKDLEKVQTQKGLRS